MLDIPDDIYNPNGGAISLGHPIGASGSCALQFQTFGVIIVLFKKLCISRLT